MIITTSFAQILPEQDAVPDYMAILHRKMRRMRWFDYVRRRFDMVAFDDVADWCAREPASLDRDEGRRTKAYQELLTAIRLGEFGPGEWPAIAHMPRNVPTYRPYCLRLSCGQIAILSAWDLGLAADLWAPRQLVALWFQRRGIQPPLWLIEEGDEPKQTPDSPPLECPTQTADQPKQKKNVGGRPPKWDWAAFDREMMRLANTPDGLPTREELTRHMLDWAIQNWGDTPADSMVRDRIAERYPK